MPTTAPAWTVDSAADVDQHAAAQRRRDTVLHKGFDLRKKYEAQVRSARTHTRWDALCTLACTVQVAIALYVSVSLAPIKTLQLVRRGLRGFVFKPQVRPAGVRPHPLSGPLADGCGRAQVAAGEAKDSSGCYDYVSDSVATFKHSVSDTDVQEYTRSIYQCGNVQSFGAFLAVHPTTYCVLACSSHTEKFLGRPWREVMGQTIHSLFQESEKVKLVLGLADISVANPVLLTPVGDGSRKVNTVVSRAAMRVRDAGALKEVQGYVFEVEETGVSPDAPETEGMWQAHQLMREAVTRLQQCPSSEILAVAVEEVYRPKCIHTHTHAHTHTHTHAHRSISCAGWTE